MQQIYCNMTSSQSTQQHTTGLKWLRAKQRATGSWLCTSWRQWLAVQNPLSSTSVKGLGFNLCLLLHVYFYFWKVTSNKCFQENHPQLHCNAAGQCHSTNPSSCMSDCWLHQMLHDHLVCKLYHMRMYMYISILYTLRKCLVDAHVWSMLMRCECEDMIEWMCRR